MDNKYKLLRDWQGHKAGTIIEIDDEELAKSLVTAEVAEKFDEAQATEDAQQAADLKQAVADAVREAVEGFDNDRVSLNIEVREREEPGGFKSLGEQLVAVQRAANGNVDERLGAKAPSGGSVQADESYGYLIQDDFVPGLERIMFEENNIASRCDSREMSGNVLKWHELDNYDRTDGNRPVSFNWLEEAGTYSSSKATVKQRELQLRKMGGLFYATDELLEDAVGLESEVEGWFRDEGQFVVNDALFNGTGVGQPLGIFNAPCKIEVAEETGQTADTVTDGNVAAMFARMPARQLAGSRWYINQTVLPQLMVMQIGDKPIWTPPNGFIDAPAGLLLGRPIDYCEHCPVVGDAGDIVLANFGEYKLVRKSGGMKVATSIHVEFLTGQLTYRFTIRLNGAPKWSSVVTPQNGDTLSPFITLAARA